MGCARAAGRRAGALPADLLRERASRRSTSAHVGGFESRRRLEEPRLCGDAHPEQLDPRSSRELLAAGPGPARADARGSRAPRPSNRRHAFYHQRRPPHYRAPATALLRDDERPTGISRAVEPTQVLLPSGDRRSAGAASTRSQLLLLRLRWTAGLRRARGACSLRDLGGCACVALPRREAFRATARHAHSASSDHATGAARLFEDSVRDAHGRSLTAATTARTGGGRGYSRAAAPLIGGGASPAAQRPGAPEGVVKSTSHPRAPATTLRLRGSARWMASAAPACVWKAQRRRALASATRPSLEWSAHATLSARPGPASRADERQLVPGKPSIAAHTVVEGAHAGGRQPLAAGPRLAARYRACRP
jgi:hypothetical protein